MELYFLRHAIAAEPGSIAVRSDAERPLTEDGMKQMKKVAHGFGSMQIALDEIISSPYLRARQTAELLIDTLSLKHKIKFSDFLIPSASFKDFLKLASQYSYEQKILFVGHEPSLSSFVAALISSDRHAGLEFKKAGMCCVEVSELEFQPAARMKWFMTPQQLIALH